MGCSECNKHFLNGHERCQACNVLFSPVVERLEQTEKGPVLHLRSNITQKIRVDMTVQQLRKEDNKGDTFTLVIERKEQA